MHRPAPLWLLAYHPYLPSAASFRNERGLIAYFQSPLGIEDAVKLDEFSNKSGPAGLVAGAQPGTIVAMEVFIEEDVVAPVGIALELLGASRSPRFGSLLKKSRR
jgi:hypothetical protein